MKAQIEPIARGHGARTPFSLGWNLRVEPWEKFPFDMDAATHDHLHRPVTGALGQDSLEVGGNLRAWKETIGEAESESTIYSLYAYLSQRTELGSINGPSRLTVDGDNNLRAVVSN